MLFQSSSCFALSAAFCSAIASVIFLLSSCWLWNCWRTSKSESNAARAFITWTVSVELKVSFRASRKKIAHIHGGHLFAYSLFALCAVVRVHAVPIRECCFRGAFIGSDDFDRCAGYGKQMRPDGRDHNEGMSLLEADCNQDFNHQFMHPTTQYFCLRHKHFLNGDRQDPGPATE